MLSGEVIGQSPEHMTATATSKLMLAYWGSLPEAALFRAFCIFAGVLFGFRLLVLAIIPLDLSGDEAYYWEWGRHLDWGYFSKPPGIAWLMAVAGKVGGNTTFGIRMFAALLGTGTLIFIFLLTRRLYGSAVALITAVAFVANPANAALNLILTIDAPLMFFWALSLYAFWEFIRRDTNRFKWGGLLALGLLGGMLSKQMMLVFHPLAILYLAVSKNHRAQLKRPGLWFVLLGSLVAWLPPLWWNMQNNWITVRHTMHHFESGGVSLGKQVSRFFEFVGSQLGIITPVLYVLTIALVIAVFWCWKRLGDRERFLWMFGGPALLVILLMGLRQRVNPNWPAVFYSSTIILLVAWGTGKWSLGLKLDRWRQAFVPGMKIAVGFAVAVYILVFAVSFGLLHLPGLDPTARIRGWSQLAVDIDAVRRELPGGSEMPLISQSHRFLASELAFFLSDHPRVFIFSSDPKSIKSQYDLWEMPTAHLGRDALIVVQGDPQSMKPGLRNRFESVTLHGILRYPQQGKALQAVTLAIGRNLQDWPGLKD